MKTAELFDVMKCRIVDGKFCGVTFGYDGIITVYSEHGQMSLKYVEGMKIVKANGDNIYPYEVAMFLDGVTNVYIGD